MTTSISQDHLLACFRRLGISRGSSLMVHASLRAFGPIEGGAQAVVGALAAAVGPEGVVLMPSFNHGASFAPGGVGFYDPRVTPSESGAVSEALRTTPGAVRSLHPTHAFAALGRGAQGLLAGHASGVPFGEDSPLGRLARASGLLLNLGTTYETTSLKHLAELRAGARCFSDQGDLFSVRQEDGSFQLRTSLRYRSRPCPLTEDGSLLQSRLAEAGVETTQVVGQATVTLVAISDFLRVAQGLLQSGAAEGPPCRSCPIREGARREGDWGPAS